MTDHTFTALETNQRGFKFAPPIPSEYGGETRVYESSAIEPHVWLKVDCPADLNRPDGPTIEAVGHLTTANARELAAQIVAVCDSADQRFGVSDE